MVKTYNKGYRAERELVHLLYKKGYAVIRTPRSGRIALPSPDIIAIKNKKTIAIECKYRSKPFKMSKDQINELLEWKKRANCDVLIAWKIPRYDWFFIPIQYIHNGNVNKNTLKNALTIDDL